MTVFSTFCSTVIWQVPLVNQRPGGQWRDCSLFLPHVLYSSGGKKKSSCGVLTHLTLGLWKGQSTRQPKVGLCFGSSACQASCWLSQLMTGLGVQTVRAVENEQLPCTPVALGAGYSLSLAKWRKSPINELASGKQVSRWPRMEADVKIRKCIICWVGWSRTFESIIFWAAWSAALCSMSVLWGVLAA